VGKALFTSSARWLWLVLATAVAVVCVAYAVGAWAQGVHGWFLLMCSGLAEVSTIRPSSRQRASK
jgi:hypothetical protein